MEQAWLSEALPEDRGEQWIGESPPEADLEFKPPQTFPNSLVVATSMQQTLRAAAD